MGETVILRYAIVLISLAFVFYTLGVWSEKIQGRLQVWHSIVFWIGFAFDTAGTIAMSRITGAHLQFTLHTVTGLLAIVIMLFMPHGQQQF